MNTTYAPHDLSTVEGRRKYNEELAEADAVRYSYSGKIRSFDTATNIANIRHKPEFFMIGSKYYVKYCRKMNMQIYELNSMDEVHAFLDNNIIEAEYRRDLADAKGHFGAAIAMCNDLIKREKDFKQHILSLEVVKFNSIQDLRQYSDNITKQIEANSIAEQQAINAEQISKAINYIILFVLLSIIFATAFIK